MDHNDFIRPFINFDETVFPRFCPSCTQQTEDLVMTRHQILNWNKSDCDCHSLFWMKSCVDLCNIFVLSIFELAKSRIKVYSQSVYESIKWRVGIQNPISLSKDQVEHFKCNICLFESLETNLDTTLTTIYYGSNKLYFRSVSKIQITLPMSRHQNSAGFEQSTVILYFGFTLVC